MLRVLGCKNWTFAGAGGWRAAAFYTLIETCKLKTLIPRLPYRRPTISPRASTSCGDGRPNRRRARCLSACPCVVQVPPSPEAFDRPRIGKPSAGVGTRQLSHRDRRAIRAVGRGHPRDPRQYDAHKHLEKLAWLAAHPKGTFHLTPTSCSWLNAAEGFFSRLTRQSPAPACRPRSICTRASPACWPEPGRSSTTRARRDGNAHYSERRCR